MKVKLYHKYDPSEITSMMIIDLIEENLKNWNFSMLKQEKILFLKKIRNNISEYILELLEENEDD